MADPATLPPPGDPRTLYVLDISSYVFRAYHALPPLSTSRGEPTNAVAGVAGMLQKLLEEQKPVHLAVAIDARGGSFRKELFDAYKATRKETPADLIPQLARVREMVTAWRMPAFEAPGFEADDVIATIVRVAQKAGWKTVIVSADKDLLQLVGGDVVMYDTMRGKVYGPEETVERLGVPPAQVRDLLALTGDTSDNVPGVPSVGPKTASKLLADHGTLDGIYAHLDAVGGKSLRAKLEENKDRAYLSRELVTLREDVPIAVDEAAVRFAGGDATELRKLFGELELTRMLGRLEPAPRDAGHREILLDLEAIERAAKAAREAGRLGFVIALDRVGDARHGRIVGFGLSWAEGTSAYVPVGHRYVGAPEMPKLDDVLGVLRPLFENSLFPKISSDAKLARVVLARHGTRLRGVVLDTMLGSYLLDPERHGHDLATVAQAELGLDLVREEQLVGKGKEKLAGADEAEVALVADHAARGADALVRLEAVLAPRFAEGAFRHLLAHVELPLADVLATMEETGIRLDTALLAKLSKDAETELERLRRRCVELAGHEFNVDSPRQLETILFDELALPVVKRTKTARSTDQQVLEELSMMHELPLAIVEHRQLAKLKSTYLDALPAEVDPKTGRIHTTFHQAVAATGRLSSANPNLQNIPIRTELGRRVRDAFVPEEGWSMMSADYSQIELRVLAHLSRDPELMDAYRTDADVHVRTATALFDVPAEKVTREMRDRAKTVNFAVIYGQTQFALAQSLRIERAEAKRYIDAFFERYAGVRRYMDELITQAHDTGYVTTLLGRRRSIPDIRSTSHNLRMAAERVARNTPIQGTAADIIKVAMVAIAADMRKREMKARMLLQVHDELVFEAPEDERGLLADVVRGRMETAVALDVPLRVEVGWGPTWGAAH